MYATVRTRRVGPLVVSDMPDEDDVVWTWYSDMLVYDRVKQIFEQLSGCSFASVAFSDGSLEPAEPLWELRVTGFAGFAGAGRGVDVRSRCDECGIYSYTFDGPFADLIDLRKWDGSDIFTVWPFPYRRVCTAKAADVLRNNGVRGIALVPIEDFDLPPNSAAPGLPSAQLDVDAARRLMNDPDYMDAVWPT
jgi:hypothetical protein